MYDMSWQCHITSHSMTQHHTLLYPITQYHIAPHGVTSYHTVLHRITQYHIASHSRYCTAWHSVTSYDVTPHHTASHHTMSQHVTQYHTASHSITSPDTLHTYSIAWRSCLQMIACCTWTVRATFDVPISQAVLDEAVFFFFLFSCCT